MDFPMQHNQSIDQFGNVVLREYKEEGEEYENKSNNKLNNGKYKKIENLFLYLQLPHTYTHTQVAIKTIG